LNIQINKLILITKCPQLLLIIYYYYYLIIIIILLVYNILLTKMSVK